MISNRERNYKFKVDEHTHKVSAMFQFANAFVIKMIDTAADCAKMSETERTALFQIYLDGIEQVDKAWDLRESKIST